MLLVLFTLLKFITVNVPAQIWITAPNTLSPDCDRTFQAMNDDSVNIHVLIVGPIVGWWGPYAASYKRRVPKGATTPLAPWIRTGTYYYLSYASNKGGHSCMRRDTVRVLASQPRITDLKADPVR